MAPFPMQSIFFQKKKEKKNQFQFTAKVEICFKDPKYKKYNKQEGIKKNGENK